MNTQEGTIQNSSNTAVNDNIYFITPGKKLIHDGESNIKYENQPYLVFRIQQQKKNSKGALQFMEDGTTPIIETSYNAYPEPGGATPEKAAESKKVFDAARAKAGEIYYASATFAVPEVTGTNEEQVMAGIKALFTDLDGSFKYNEAAQAVNRGTAQKLGNRHRAFLAEVQIDSDDNPVIDAEGYYIPTYPYNVEGLVTDSSGMIVSDTQRRGLSAADRIGRQIEAAATAGKSTMSTAEIELIMARLEELKKSLSTV